MESVARKIVHRLQDAGHEAFFAGGCVRDSLMGKMPHDFDIATSARPNRCRRSSRALFQLAPNSVSFSSSNKAENIRSQHSAPTARISTAATPECDVHDGRGGRKAQGFHVNGLFYDPIEETSPGLCGGGRIWRHGRCEPSETPPIASQRTNFASCGACASLPLWEFEIEVATWDAIRAGAPAIREVSAERVRDELVKTFASPQRVRGFDLLDASGLMAEILPEISNLKGCEQPPDFHPEGDVFLHTRLMLSLLPERVSVPLSFAVLFHDFGKPATMERDATGRIRFSGHESVSAHMAGEIMRRLRFSNEEIEATVEMVHNHMVFKDVQKMRVARLKRFMARPTFEDELELHRVDCLGSHGLLDNYEFLRRRREEFANEPLIPHPSHRSRSHWLGLETGSKVPGCSRRGPECANSKARLHTREEALEWVTREFAGPVRA